MQALAVIGPKGGNGNQTNPLRSGESEANSLKDYAKQNA
jgi:hypothetical protein